MVRAIDDRDVDVCLGEFAGDVDTPETAPTTTTLGRPPPDAVIFTWTYLRRSLIAPRNASDISRTTSVCVETSVLTQS